MKEYSGLSLNFSTPHINYLNTAGAGRGVSENQIIVIVLVKYILTTLVFNYLRNPFGQKKFLFAVTGRS